MRNNKRKKEQRSYNYMLSIRVDHLPDGKTLDDMCEAVDRFSPDKWAGILHNRDIDEKGSLVAPHIHIMIHLKNARSTNGVAKALGVSPGNLKLWDDSLNNGWAYLLHETDDARESKYPYSCDDVIANFDFRSKISTIRRGVARRRAVAHGSKNIMDIYNAVADGTVSKRDALQQLSGEEYVKYSKGISQAHEKYLIHAAEKIRAEMRDSGELVRVHWLYGKTATGKTSFATAMASKRGPVYKTSTTKDPFQDYQAEPVILLDELRPGTIPYSELLAMFDPFSGGTVTVSSRFYNKPLAYKEIFVTSPYDPFSFYKECRKKAVDSGDQLYRRLSSVLLFDMEFIHDMAFDASTQKYISRNKTANSYSRKKRKPAQLTSIFEEIREENAGRNE